MPEPRLSQREESASAFEGAFRFHDACELCVCALLLDSALAFLLAATLVAEPVGRARVEYIQLGR